MIHTTSQQDTQPPSPHSLASLVEQQTYLNNEKEILSLKRDNLWGFRPEQQKNPEQARVKNRGGTSPLPPLHSPLPLPDRTILVHDYNWS